MFMTTKCLTPAGPAKISVARRPHFGITLCGIENYMRYLVLLLLAALLPISSLAEGIESAPHHGQAAKHLTLARAKAKKAPKAKKAKKAKKAPRAKKAKRAKKGSSIFRK
jgi:hypothetical protein